MNPSPALQVPSSPRSSQTRWALIATAGIGALVALQVQVNGELATAAGGGLRAGLLAALVSFGSGLVVLCALAATPPVRRGLGRVLTAVRSRDLRWWQVVGGAFGAMLVAAQGVAAPTIGVALFTVAMVAGQSGGGLAVDRWGLGPGGSRAITLTRGLGAGLTVVAVGLAVSGRLTSAAGLTVAAALLTLMPLLAGMGLSFQAAVNGQVAARGGPLAAAWLNFVVGTTVLLVLNLAAWTTGGAAPSLPAPVGGDLLLYTGGVIGVVFIAATAALVRVLGVLVVGLASLAGQIVTATVLDVVGGVPLGPATLAGAVLTLVGVGIAARR